MRIAVVYRHFNLSGSLPRWLVETTRALVERDHDIHVFSVASTRDASLVPGCTHHSVPVAAVTPGQFSVRELLSFARNAEQILSREHFDTVYTLLPSTWVGDIVHFSGVFHPPLRSKVRHPGQAAMTLLEGRAVRRAGRFHADSRIVRDNLARWRGVDPDEVVVLPPGINLDEFTPGDQQEARRRLGLPDRPQVLFCGHDFERKGLDRLIQAVALLELRPALVVVGGGDRRLYERLAREAEVDVTFVGAQTGTADFYRAADAFVLPTREEMWGSTVIEAMACSCPAVVTANAGVADAVVDGESGFVVSEGCPPGEVAGVIGRLLGSSRLRGKLAEAGAETARGYSWRARTARLEQELAAAGRTRQRGGLPRREAHANR